MLLTFRLVTFGGPKGYHAYLNYIYIYRIEFGIWYLVLVH
jgi:hypothetical protein